MRDQQFASRPSDVASLHEVVDEISDPDHGGEEQAVIQLHHYPLPRPDAANVDNYDARSNAIRYHGHPDLEHLERPFDARTPGSGPYRFGIYFRPRPPV